MSIPRLLLLALVPVAASCSSPPPTVASYEDPLPAARLAALGESASAGDRADARQIIEQLDSDDAAVRWTAWMTLRRMEQETFGFDATDDPARRDDALRRWVAALRRERTATEQGARP